eukprot:CAMPEP_0177646088 /NCGR_PEP_ID=MMETSP0447-20121125/9588_1 /TAXON_ID=0 /ORGANISM="Stygamoeba regulata, Strain BSH-02190019" /LENGTH=868 /DNA_ID=CAMNT_0019148599 /DNA_START=53 /DNA_END=2659 /DNA_ORIENTATION=-
MATQTGSGTELEKYLVAGYSNDAQARAQCLAFLERLLSENLGMGVGKLAEEMANEKTVPGARQMAGTYIKNALYSDDASIFRAKAKQWLDVPAELRNKIKPLLLQPLASKVSIASRAAARAVSAVATIEIPAKQWIELLDMLRNVVTNPELDMDLRKNSMNCLGSICEHTPSEALAEHSDKILTAIMTGMRPEAGTQLISEGARAFYHCIESASKNFSRPKERDLIMTVIHSTCNNEDDDVKVLGLECLVEIARVYYAYLGPYMEGLYNVTIAAIKHEEEEIAKQGVEFWCTLTDAELDIQWTIEEALSCGERPEVELHNYLKAVAGNLIPLLLETMTKQEEGDSIQQYSLPMAAATCLSLIAQLLSDLIVPLVMKFVSDNIVHEDWHRREASTMAFGSILDGPSHKALKDWISKALPAVAKQLEDPVAEVKDTAAWTLGKICQLHPAVVKTNLEPLLQVATSGLSMTPRVASNCCFAIHSIAQAYEDEAQAITTPISKFFLKLIELLLQAADRQDKGTMSLREAAYETINALITTGAMDTIEYSLKLVPTFMHRLLQAIQVVNAHASNPEIREKGHQMFSHLVSALYHITCKVEEKIEPHAADLMKLYQQVLLLSAQTNNSHEETLIAVGAIANTIEEKFENFIGMINDVILLALKLVTQPTSCMYAIGCVGDFSRALGPKITPFAKGYLQILVADLNHDGLEPYVKPHIISCIGDIAMAIGAEFAQYMEPVGQILQVAAHIQKPEDPDEDFLEFWDSLRLAILDTYTSILQGLRSAEVGQLFAPFAEFSVLYVEHVWQDDDRNLELTKSCIGLLGDIAQTLGPKAAQLFRRESMKVIIETGKLSRSQEVSRLAKWAEKLMLQALGQ